MTGGIRDDTTRSRFELEVDGETAFSEYTLAPGRIIFVHTEVPAALAGRGVASQLIRGALDAVRARGLKVNANCPFVAAFIAKHGECRDLLG